MTREEFETRWSRAQKGLGSGYRVFKLAGKGRDMYRVKNGKGKAYEVFLPEAPEQASQASCTCPDHVERGMACKHILMVATRLWGADAAEHRFRAMVAGPVRDQDPQQVLEAGRRLLRGESEQADWDDPVQLRRRLATEEPEPEPEPESDTDESQSHNTEEGTMNSNTTYEAIMAELKKPFEPADVMWKPGAISKDKTRAMALAYVDARTYMERLDQAARGQWEDDYEVLLLPDRVIVVCRLTIAGVCRTGDGEALLTNGKGEPEANAVTTASAQAFKRACAKHGLGRYLYDLPRRWVDYDQHRRCFTREAVAELRQMLAGGGPGNDTDNDDTATPARPSRNGNGGNGTPRDDGNLVVRFGRHTGKSLGQIARDDPGYLRWLSENWQWEQGRQAAQRLLASIQAQAETA